MQGYISQLSDSMNFPESNRVTKREPLSNIIFKITQSTEKVNRRNERLLQLNLDYELRMLRLARQKEQKIFKKLDSEKRCSFQTKGWLLGGFDESDCLLNEGRKNYEVHYKQKDKKKKEVEERLSLPKLVVNKPVAKDKEHLPKSNFTTERTLTAPLLKLKNVNDFKKTVLSRNARSADTKRTEIFHGNDELVAIQGIVNVDCLDAKTEDNGDITANLFDAFCGVTDTASLRTRPPQEQTGAIILDSEASTLNDRMASKEFGSYSQLLQKAKESTEKQAAYIPVDSSYRRACSTRKKCQDAEGKRPRILNRYLKEKREFETLIRDR
eukprot:gene2880-1117_t